MSIIFDFYTVFDKTFRNDYILLCQIFYIALKHRHILKLLMQLGCSVAHFSATSYANCKNVLICLFPSFNV